MTLVASLMRALAQQSKCGCKRRAAAVEILELVAQRMDEMARKTAVLGGPNEYEAAARLIRAEITEGREPR